MAIKVYAKRSTSTRGKGIFNRTNSCIVVFSTCIQTTFSYIVFIPKSIMLISGNEVNLL